MPRPKTATKKNLKERAQKIAKRKTKLEKGYVDDTVGYAIDALRGLGIGERKAASSAKKLISLLTEIRDDFPKLKQFDLRSSQPMINGVCVTAGTMEKTLRPMARAAKALNETYEIAPAGVIDFIKLPLPEINDEFHIDLGLVIRRLNDLLSKEHLLHLVQTKGGKKKDVEFTAKARCAAKLIKFVKEISPETFDKKEKEIQTFIHQCLGFIGIECTSPSNPTKFKKFYSRVKLFADFEKYNFSLGKME